MLPLLRLPSVRQPRGGIAIVAFVAVRYRRDERRDCSGAANRRRDCGDENRYNKDSKMGIKDALNTETLIRQESSSGPTWRPRQANAAADG